MSSDTNSESKTKKPADTTTQEPEDRFTTNDSILATLSGMLVAISLLLADLLLVFAGSVQVFLVSFAIHYTVLLSSLYVVSLVGGYYVGKARLEDSPLTVITYGGLWVLSIFIGGLYAFTIGYLSAVISILALTLGGIGLAAYRFLQGDKGIDGMFQIVLLACTAINFLYFAVGG